MMLCRNIRGELRNEVRAKALVQYPSKSLRSKVLGPRVMCSLPGFVTMAYKLHEQSSRERCQTRFSARKCDLVYHLNSSLKARE